MILLQFIMPYSSISNLHCRRNISECQPAAAITVVLVRDWCAVCNESDLSSTQSTHLRPTKQLSSNHGRRRTAGLSEQEDMASRYAGALQVCMPGCKCSVMNTSSLNPLLCGHVQQACACRLLPWLCMLHAKCLSSINARVLLLLLLLPPPPAYATISPATSGRMQNLEEVWKREQAAAAEQRKLEELRKQYEDERKNTEFTQMAEEAGYK